jgi:hypothetical protein
VDATPTVAPAVSQLQRRLLHLAVALLHLAELCHAARVLVPVVHHAVLLRSRVMMLRVQRLVVPLHFLVDVAVKHHVVMHQLRRGSVENKLKVVKQFVNY